MTRNKTDLHHPLASAYDAACAEFQRLHPNLPQPFITCAIRTGAEQDELYTHGRTKPGPKVTNAIAGKSPHNFNPSFAFDIAFISVKKELDWSHDLFRIFADIIKKIEPQITPGIDFVSIPDAPHFEITTWRALSAHMQHV